MHLNTPRLHGAGRDNDDCVGMKLAKTTSIAPAVFLRLGV